MPSCCQQELASCVFQVPGLRRIVSSDAWRPYLKVLSKDAWRPCQPLDTEDASRYKQDPKFSEVQSGSAPKKILCSKCAKAKVRCARLRLAARQCWAGGWRRGRCAVRMKGSHSSRPHNPRRHSCKSMHGCCQMDEASRPPALPERRNTETGFPSLGSATASRGSVLPTCASRTPASQPSSAASGPPDFVHRWKHHGQTEALCAV
jgi:hypothetical protein